MFVVAVDMYMTETAQLDALLRALERLQFAIGAPPLRFVELTGDRSPLNERRPGLLVMEEMMECLTVRFEDFVDMCFDFDPYD